MHQDLIQRSSCGRNVSTHSERTHPVSRVRASRRNRNSRIVPLSVGLSIGDFRLSARRSLDKQDLGREGTKENEGMRYNEEANAALSARSRDKSEFILYKIFKHLSLSFSLIAFFNMNFCEIIKIITST